MTAFGFQVGGTLTTGRVTLPAAAVGTQTNFRAVFLRALATNAADDCEYGPPGFTAGTGAPLPAGERVPVPLNDLTQIAVLGTAGNVVAWEGYR